MLGRPWSRQRRGSPLIRKPGGLRGLGALARRSARVLARWADKLDPVWSAPSQFIRPGELSKLPNIGRLDFDALRDGRIVVQYGALDPFWRQHDEASGMIDLREHTIRLCSVTNELAAGDPSGSWWPVSENLLLAASLTDLSADTDVHNTSMMCRPAAEYEHANTELTEKHLAGVIIANLVWTAFECAVEAVAGPTGRRKPKGASGRDILFASFGDRRFPQLRATVLQAIRTAPATPAFTSDEAKRALVAGAWAAIGAEHLRQFRNAMVHGQVRKPEPKDGGDRSEYVIDADPVIMQFEANVRLLLILIQILGLQVVEPTEEIFGWKSDPAPADIVLSQLHCIVEEDDQLHLPLRDAPLLTPDDY